MVSWKNQEHEGTSADGTGCGDGRRSGGSLEHEHDAFLSFRGSDARESIADRRCSRLVDDAGWTVPILLSRDAEGLLTRGELGSQLLESYAAGKWCPRKLVGMMENGKSTGHVFMPIFDGVEPRGRFKEAFLSHRMCSEQRDVKAGQQELRDVSFLRGWESEKIANGHQGEFVRIVVATDLTESRKGFWVYVAETPVGIGDNVKKIIILLDSIRTIGIYGMVGIGKITLTFGEFMHRSFFSDIQEKIDHSSR